MNEIPDQVNVASFEAIMTGIYEHPAELLARSASRVAAVACRYSTILANKRRRSSNAQLRRLDQLEQCGHFFWMCCEAVEKDPDIAIQLLDQKVLLRWDGRQNGIRSLFHIYQSHSYTSVLGVCLDMLLDLATDHYMPDVFSIADFQCFLSVALRFPEPEFRFVNPTGKIQEVISNETPERIRRLIESWSS